MATPPALTRAQILDSWCFLKPAFAKISSVAPNER
jgi:hypothetical protein